MWPGIVTWSTFHFDSISGVPESLRVVVILHWDGHGGFFTVHDNRWSGSVTTHSERRCKFLQEVLLHWEVSLSVVRSIQDEANVHHRVTGWLRRLLSWNGDIRFYRTFMSKNGLARSLEPWPTCSGTDLLEQLHIQAYKPIWWPWYKRDFALGCDKSLHQNNSTHFSWHVNIDRWFHSERRNWFTLS